MTVVWDSDKNIENVKSGIRLWTMGCKCTTGCFVRCGCRKRKSTCGPACKYPSSCTNQSSSDNSSNTQSGHSQSAIDCAGDNTGRAHDGDGDGDDDDDFYYIDENFSSAAENDARDNLRLHNSNEGVADDIDDDENEVDDDDIDFSDDLYYDCGYSDEEL